jgi:gamma-glutamyltranspeptidase/glutathione hydrolase
MAAVLNVVEPTSTGIGGDVFALIYTPGETIKGINGSGYSPRGLSYEYLVEERNLRTMPSSGVLSITVPGALSAWEIIHEKYGKLSWYDILQPAIHYAREGFPVSPTIAQIWSELTPKLLRHEGARKTYLIDGKRAPTAGEIIKQESLASTLNLIAKEGVSAFYRGVLAEKIEVYIQAEGGFLTISDLKKFKAEWTKPISREIYNTLLWEHGPNGQGIITPMILAIAEELDIGRYSHNSVDYLHCLIEAKKLAFSDGFAHIAEPTNMIVPISKFLSEEYAQTRASQINPQKAMDNLPLPINMGNDTVYLTTADSEGQVISFINSLFSGFGSGIVDPNTGIAFQNRGGGFSLQKGHPNQYEPHKRPYHTIIPGMITDTENRLLYSFGVMGGHHQPQGQAQVFLNLILHGFDPQEAIECPRFHHDQVTNVVALETPIPLGVRSALRRFNHNIIDCVGINFGGGQIIKQDGVNGSYSAGSDPRKDGQAQGY